MGGDISKMLPSHITGAGVEDSECHVTHCVHPNQSTNTLLAVLCSGHFYEAFVT